MHQKGTENYSLAILKRAGVQMGLTERSIQIYHVCLWSSVLLKSGSPLALHSTLLLNGCINGYNILQD